MVSQTWRPRWQGSLRDVGPAWVAGPDGRYRRIGGMAAITMARAWLQDLVMVHSPYDLPSARVDRKAG